MSTHMPVPESTLCQLNVSSTSTVSANFTRSRCLRCVAFREDRGGGGMDAPVGAGGPDVPGGASEAPPVGERPKLKLAPRSRPIGEAAGGGAGSGPAPAPATAKKASIFGGGKAHDEFAYEVRAGVPHG